MGAIGILVYGPQMLIAVLAIDLVPKFAVGWNDDFIGLFGYVFGEVIASYLIGKLVDSLGWTASFWVIIIVAIIAFVCFIILIKAENDIDKQLNKIYKAFDM